MKRTTRGLLIGAIASLVAGLIFSSNLIQVPNAAAGVYVLLPVGAILLGLFLIAKGLEKETTRYDEEQRANQARATEPDHDELPAEPSHPAHAHEESFAQSH